MYYHTLNIRNGTYNTDRLNSLNLKHKLKSWISEGMAYLRPFKKILNTLQ